MPNYVRNIIQYTNYDEHILRKIKSRLVSKEFNGAIDFQRLIPNPRTIIGVENYSREDAILALYYLSCVEHVMIDVFVLKQFKENVPDLYKKAMDNILNAGTVCKEFVKENNIDVNSERSKNVMKKFAMENPHANWYKWNVANWNTKWNASDAKWINDYTLIFDTAWDVPIPIIYKIAELFPDVPFSYMWSDEGMCFAGKAYYDPSCREIVTIDTSNDTKEACDNFYKYCWGIDGGYEWDDGNE